MYGAKKINSTISVNRGAIATCMFANFATWPNGPTNENLAKYCKERLIPFRINDDGKPYAKFGDEWFLLKCRPTATPNRYCIYMTDEE